MAANQDVWVFSEKLDLLAELIAGGHTLADPRQGQVVALVLGPRSAAEAALARGAQRVLWLGEMKPGGLVDDYVNTLQGLFQEDSPYALLIGSTKRGRAVAGRLAARLNTTALADVLAFMEVSGALQARHLIFGGGAVRVDQPLSAPIIATVGQGVFEAAKSTPAGAGSEAIRDVPMIEPDWQATLRQTKTRPPATVNLAAARKVVCAGRGLAKQEDLSLVKELAQLLGAEVACSRPLAEGLDWLPRERYIGISGAMIKPDLYLGVGVSGQVQHQIGMNDSRLVVAINKDKNAPIFANADYGIAEDLYVIVPELIKALKARK